MRKNATNLPQHVQNLNLQTRQDYNNSCSFVILAYSFLLVDLSQSAQRNNLEDDPSTSTDDSPLKPSIRLVSDFSGGRGC